MLIQANILYFILENNFILERNCRNTNSSQENYEPIDIYYGAHLTTFKFQNGSQSDLNWNTFYLASFETENEVSSVDTITFNCPHIESSWTDIIEKVGCEEDPFSTQTVTSWLGRVP